MHHVPITKLPVNEKNALSDLKQFKGQFVQKLEVNFLFTSLSCFCCQGALPCWLFGNYFDPLGKLVTALFLPTPRWYACSHIPMLSFVCTNEWMQMEHSKDPKVVKLLNKKSIKKQSITSEWIYKCLHVSTFWPCFSLSSHQLVSKLKGMRKKIQGED